MSIRVDNIRTYKQAVERITDTKVLECSSKGDKRFSALYAKVNVFGKYDTIESHYQKCKRDEEGNIAGKGKKVHNMIIKKATGPIILPPTFLTAYYKLLWCSYLDLNPKLVKYAKQFDDYHDMFRGKAINCQADVIRQYIKEGRKSILKEPDVIELRKRLNI